MAVLHLFNFEGRYIMVCNYVKFVKLVVHSYFPFITKLLIICI